MESAERSQWRELFQQAPAFICTLRGPDHVFELANEQYRRLVGHRELIGKPIREALPESLEQGFVELLDRVYRTGEAFRGNDVRVLVQRRAGAEPDELFLDFTYQPIRDAEGRTTGSFVLGVDVTQRRRAQTELARDALLLANVQDAVIVTDLNGVVQFWNDGASRLFGWTAAELVGRPIEARLPEHARAGVQEWIARIAAGEEFRGEWLDYRKDGSTVWIEAHTALLRDATGRALGIMGLSRDITRRKEAEEQLHAAKEAAEAANRLKDRFLAALSHELRTPLSPVLMSLSAMETDPDVPPAMRADLTVMRRNIELEVRLIDDLLDVSRITMGKLRLDLQPTHVHEVLAHAAKNVEGELADRRLQLDLQADQDVVNADGGRLQQLFWNLLRNAIKFSGPTGQIVVRTHRRDDHLVLKVIDNGIGIAQASLERIFAAFDQGEPREVHQFGGLGLGLAIARAIAERHGGRLQASSAGTDQGATFTLDLPLLQRSTSDENATEAGAGVARKMVPAAPAERLHVLLVEDHADTAKVLAKLLTRKGFQVNTAGTLVDARALVSERPFDVIVSDLGLPDGTGYDLMSEIREQYAGRAIALSGYGMEEDIRRSESAGFVEHLVKPVALQTLINAIRRVTNRVSK